MPHEHTRFTFFGFEHPTLFLLLKEFCCYCRIFQCFFLSLSTHFTSGLAILGSLEMKLVKILNLREDIMNWQVF